MAKNPIKAPKITIDKLAVRFEWEEGSKNIFFSDLFRFPHRDWHVELLDAVQKSYEICVRENIEPSIEEFGELKPKPAIK